MNYRDYQQVIKINVSKKEQKELKNSKGSRNSKEKARLVSPSSLNSCSSCASSPLASPVLTRPTTFLSDNNFTLRSHDHESMIEGKVHKKAKITRSKNGCLCCRRRRKKCDEIHPKCGGCTRNFLDCCWPTQNATVQVSGTPSITPRFFCNVDDDSNLPQLNITSFDLNNNVLIIRDDPHLTTKTSSLDISNGTRSHNFIVTAVKANATKGMRNTPTSFPRAITVQSLLN